MQLRYTKQSTLSPKQQFKVVFSYGHGDADQTTTNELMVHLSRDEFPNYLAKVKEVSKAIYEARRTGQSLSDDFEETARYNDTPILVEYDCFGMNTMSGYYADMRVAEITYFDENGTAFDVVQHRWK